MAVVESELKMLSDTMDKVAKKPTVPDEKILELITTHLDIIKWRFIVMVRSVLISSVISGV